MTIAAYTGGVFTAIFVVFLIVMCIEKIRKKRKRITEVVELKPVDIEAHRRALAVKKSKEAARERERLMGPQRTPKPVF